MLPAESGTLPHRPWTPMSLVNGRGPQAKRCGRDEAKRKSVRKRLPLRWSRCVGDSPRKPLRHHREAATASDGAKNHREAAPQRKARHLRDEQPAEPTPSGSSYRQGRRKAPSGISSTAQSTAPSGSNCRQGNRTAPSGSSSTAQSKAASGRASCRTSTIGKRMFWQIMVQNGQV